jgi:hypothetical protein
LGASAFAAHHRQADVPAVNAHDGSRMYPGIFYFRHTLSYSKHAFATGNRWTRHTIS